MRPKSFGLKGRKWVPMMLRSPTKSSQIRSLKPRKKTNNMVRFSSIATLLLIAIASPVVFADDHDDDHEHEECACTAEEWDFAIDCSDTDTLQNSMSQLLENSCETDCESDFCKRHYFIIQSHHDYCLEGLPASVEDGIHIYEGTCDDCHIQRKFDPSLDQCPAVTCDSSGNDAYQLLLEEGCTEDCSSALCVEQFKILKAVHDTCDEETLSTVAEQSFHDFEESCEAASCNIQLDGSNDADQLICHEAEHSAAPFSVFTTALAFASLVALVGI